MKFINYEDESEKDPDFKSAVREIVLMQALMKAECNAILKIYDVYPCVRDEQKFLVLVMELCDCNLMELIKVRIEEGRSCWSEEELLYILFQLVEGFYLMKRHSVTHRDIKPQNILYSSEDKWYKIADLGGSKFLKPPASKQSLDGKNTVRGSPAYWAPEIYYYCELQKDKEGRFFVGKQHLPYNPYQSDVYSVGITLLLMKKLVPRLDREGIKKEVESMRRSKQGSYLEQVLVRMLESDESKRMSFEQVYEVLGREKGRFKQPKEDVYVNCLKTGKERKSMSGEELLEREIDLGEAYEKLLLLEHAKSHYEQAYRLAHKQGKDSLKADILNNMGTVNCDLGQLDEAERNYLDCLAYYKKIHGEKHTSVGDAYNNLGIVKRKKGEYEKAIKCYEAAYHIKEQVFGENNLGVALILGNLGMAYRKLGDLDQSLKYYKSALQLKKLICGDASIILCATYDNLARVYYLKAQFDQAISCYQITTDIYRKSASSNPHRLADALFELGQCYQNTARPADAVKAFTEASTIRNQEQNSKDHIICLEHLASSLLEDK